MLKKFGYFVLLGVLAVGGLLAQPGVAAPYPPDPSLLTWEQANSDGFGAATNEAILSLVEYQGRLYAGTRNDTLAGQVWRRELNGSWSQFLASGLGDAHNTAIPAMTVVGNILYLGTANSLTGAEVWQSAGVSAEQINSDGFGETDNQAAATLIGISGSAAGHDYADFVQVGTQNMTGGAQLWEYDGTGWITGTLNGFDDPNNTMVASACDPNHIFFGTQNQVSGAQLIEYSWGYGTWTVFQDPVGMSDNTSARSLVCLDDYYLVGTTNESEGAEIWRYNSETDTWENVVGGGFGDPNNTSISSMVAVGEYIYAGTVNPVTGAEIWRNRGHGEAGGWEQVNLDGFGDLHNSEAATLTGAGRYLYVGTRNATSGAELWRVELNGPDRSFLVRNETNWIRSYTSAYNSQDRQYLSMWLNEFDGDYDDDLQAQRLNWSGNLIGAPFMVSTGGIPASERKCPRLAYDSLHNRYLAAWNFKDTAWYNNGGVRARLLSAGGAPVGNELEITSSSTPYSWGCPEAGYSPGVDRFLLVYAREDSSDSFNIYGQVLLADGTLEGSAFLITDGASAYVDIAMAYNPVRNEFLLVWEDEYPTTDIYGRIVVMSAGAASLAAPFLISDNMDGIVDAYPAVGAIAAPPGVGEYLVAWNASISMNHSSVKARRVSGLGELAGNPVTVSEFEYHYESGHPHLSGLNNAQGFQIVWSSAESLRYGSSVLLRGMDANGNLLGSPVWLAGERNSAPHIYAGPGGTALVLFNDYPPDYIYRSLWGAIFGVNWGYLPRISK